MKNVLCKLINLTAKRAVILHLQVVYCLPWYQLLFIFSSV